MSSTSTTSMKTMPVETAKRSIRNYMSVSTNKFVWTFTYLIGRITIVFWFKPMNM